MLRAHNAAFCIYDLAGQPVPRVVSADFVYVRLHGPAGAYQGRYGDAALRDWAEACLAWAGEGREVFCYFDNDEAAHAPHDAQRLRRLVRGA